MNFHSKGNRAVTAMIHYERANIQKMKGYVPGEQPDSADVVKLNTNENPYPAAEAVIQSLHSIAAESLRRYPQPTARDFCDIAAGMHRVHPNNVLAVNGGDELLRLVITTFVDPHQPIGVAEPTYALYRVLAAIQDCPVVSAQLAEDWSLPQDFAFKMNESGVKLVIITNPHAPSGYLTPVEDLAAIAEQLHGILLIDEAYVDFVDPQLAYNSIHLVGEFPNVIILRTLSKGYSLAGLRFGYGLGAQSIIEPMLTKTKDSYNVNVISQRMAMAALQHHDAASKTWAAVRMERDRLREHLEKLGFICPPSQSNFLLAEVSENSPMAAPDIYKALKQQNIYVRYFNEDRLRNKLRITVGRPDENDILLSALNKLLRKA